MFETPQCLPRDGTSTSDFDIQGQQHRYVRPTARKAVEQITTAATNQRSVLEAFQSLTLSSPSSSHQVTQSVAPDSAIPSIFASPTNSAASASQVTPDNANRFNICLVNE